MPERDIAHLDLFVGICESLGLMNKKPKPNSFETDDSKIPSWVDDRPLEGTPPYTEEELDRLVQGTLESIRDTAAWMSLVDREGEEEAVRILRSRIIMDDVRTRKTSRH